MKHCGAILIALIVLLSKNTFCVPVVPEIHGINLGGWFILEKFITPSIFRDANVNSSNLIASEWQFVESFRNDSDKLDVIRRHWDTWVQEQDIQLLATTGFNMVRLPIGYWAMLTQEELDARNESYITGQLPYLTRGIQWLKKYNIKCIIDLHGAPGSQNGWDNSGHLGPVLWGQMDTVNRTVDVIEKLAIFIRTLEEDNTTSDTVVGLELMNEAAPWAVAGGLDTIKSYYLQAYPVVRRHLPASKYIVMIEEAFSPFDWLHFMNSSEYENVVLDMHLYQCFDDTLRQGSYDTHLNVTCQIHQNIVATQTLPTVVGEWSVAYKVESNWANTEPYPNTGEISFMREFALTQMQVFGSHFFWNFKCESAPMWDYALGLEGGWLSHLPPTDSVDLCQGRR